MENMKALDDLIDDAMSEEKALATRAEELETTDFVKIAKDIWKYDLKRKATEFKNVEIYVKPEENAIYYVVNGDVTGKVEF